MRNPTITTIATYGVLALAGAAPAVLPEQLPMTGASAAIPASATLICPVNQNVCSHPICTHSDDPEAAASTNPSATSTSTLTVH